MGRSSERHFIIHWDEMSEGELRGWPEKAYGPSQIINGVIRNGQTIQRLLPDCDDAPYEPPAQVVIYHRPLGYISMLQNYVQQGDRIILYGVRTTVCVAEARRVIGEKIGWMNVWLHPRGTFD